MIRPLLLTVALGIVGYTSYTPSPIRVIDGDTIKLRGERYRLATHDAPEIFSPRCPQERALGLRAKTRLYELTRGVFSLLHVPCTYRYPGEPKRDRYGRQCAVLKIEQESEWVDVGFVLIREKLAVEFPGNGRQDWCK